MKKVLVLAAVVEVATGLALLVVPSFVSRLLLGEELSGVAIPIARVTGSGYRVVYYKPADQPQLMAKESAATPLTLRL